MSFQDQINQDIKAAMLARESAKLGVLRMLKTALMNSAIEKGGAGSMLEDTEALAIVRKEVKKRQDSIEAFEKGGRPEMAATEKAEIEVLSAYLPQPLSAEELAALVQSAIAETGATSRKEMGAVMKIVNDKASGRADGRTISAEVQKHLAARFISLTLPEPIRRHAQKPAASNHKPPRDIRRSRYTKPRACFDAWRRRRMPQRGI